jgi:transposase InsO family protein
MCGVLGVSPGVYDGRRRRPPTLRRRRREAPVAAIKAVHTEAKARSGSPRIHAESVARGRPRGVDTVAAPMRRHGIAAETKRESRCATDSHYDRPVAEGLVARRFEPAAADRVWTAEIPSIATREGWPYLAAEEDRHSRRIVGGSMSERIDSRQVADAPGMALAQRLPREGPVAHPDRGSRHSSEHYRRLLASHGIPCSMSRRGDGWDDAPMESFFAGLKMELVDGADVATRAEAWAELFESIEVFCDRLRRHSAPGYRSPDDDERAARPLTPRSPFLGKSNPTWLR